MKKFMDEDFLLLSEPAKKLYHDYAENMPILDYHCHISPKEIAEDRHFDNITQVWLGGDHYKWRLMRAFGLDEKYMTGDASDKEKFLMFAKCLGRAVGNPLYHWGVEFYSTHEMLLEQLSQHKLDMIISDCPIDSTQQEGLFSVRIGECGVSFWCTNPPPEKPFPACLEERRLLIPGRRSMLGRKLLNWFNSQGLNVEILGEFDDAALMKAFGAMHNAIFVAPTLYAYDFYADKTVVEIGRVENVMEEYHAIFAERMIQHPAVQRICNTDYSALFSPAAR